MLKKLYSLISIDDGPEEALLAIEPVKVRLENLSPGYRSQLKSRLVGAGYPSLTVGAIFPPAPSRAAPAGWEYLARAGRDAVQSVLKMSLADVVWGPDEARQAASAISDAYSNTSTAATQLSRFRKILRDLGTDPDIVSATRMPEITTRHNELAAKARSKAASEPLRIPDRFKRVADLAARVAEYIDEENKFSPDAEMAADLLVTFSARPGEANTLDIGPGGGLIGMLKKRGAEPAEFPVVSAVDADSAKAFLARWRASPETARTRAMRALSGRVALWGIYRKDLRAIGADMAARAAKLRGDAKSEGQIRDVKVAALRHKAPPVAAVDHYTALHDGDTQLSAKLSEADPETRKKIKALLSLTGSSLTAGSPPPDHERPQNVAGLTRRERRALRDKLTAQAE